MGRTILIGPFSQVISMGGLSIRGAVSDESLTVIENGGVLTQDGRVVEVGPYNALKDTADEYDLVKGDAVCLPGFVDAHTHICFAGSRAQDYAMRNAGKTYLEIAKSGGGIWDTVTKTRAASQGELTQNTIARANKSLLNGITTIEVKSGYGLSVEEELKMLRAIKSADTETKAELISTCLAAHIKPKDYEGTAAEYLDIIVNDLFPVLKEENLTRRIDAFIEDSAFTSDDVKRYFAEAKKAGYDITIHADQFTTSGSKLAIEVGAVSADHLEASTEKEIAMLADSDVIAMALPGASMGIGCDFTPCRKILDAGGALAIASDWNPGSAPMGDLLTQATVMSTFEKLSNAEVLAGITYRAAAALGLSDRGRLAQGEIADLGAFPTDDYREIFYQQGQMKPCSVWKNGQKI